MSGNSLLILLLFCSLKGISQQLLPSVADKGRKALEFPEERQVEYLQKIYSLKTGAEYELINGREYFQYHYRSKLKPLLFMDRKRTASITLGGRKYDDITLQYDTYTDEVIWSDTANRFNLSLYQISLNKNNIDAFTFYFTDDTLNFRYFDKDDFIDFNLTDGFYEVAYDGTIKYLIRHRSRVHERNGIDEYFYSPAGYVNTGDGFYRIKSVKQLLKLIDGNIEEMKRWTQLNEISLNKANKKQVTGILKFYDRLRTPVEL